VKSLTLSKIRVVLGFKNKVFVKVFGCKRISQEGGRGFMWIKRYLVDIGRPLATFRLMNVVPLLLTGCEACMGETRNQSLKGGKPVEK